MIFVVMPYKKAKLRLQGITVKSSEEIFSSHCGPLDYQV